jgi:hypothetical protein
MLGSATEEVGVAGHERSWPTRDAFGRLIVTADEYEAMTPRERERLHDERLVSDLETLPEGLRDRLLAGGDDLAERSEGLARRLEEAARVLSEGLRGSRQALTSRYTSSRQSCTDPR